MTNEGRILRAVGPDEARLYLDGDARRFGPGTILMLLRPEHVTLGAKPAPGAPYELVHVRECSPFSVEIDRGWYGTVPRAYPTASVVQAIATVPLERDRPRDTYDWN